MCALADEKAEHICVEPCRKGQKQIDELKHSDTLDKLTSQQAGDIIGVMIARAAMLQHMHAFFCLISRPPFLQRLTEMVKRFFQICRR